MGRWAGRKIVQNAIFHGKRHDNKISKVKMLLSSNFVVMAQAPTDVTSKRHLVAHQMSAPLCRRGLWCGIRGYPKNEKMGPRGMSWLGRRLHMSTTNPLINSALSRGFGPFSVGRTGKSRRDVNRPQGLFVGTSKLGRPRRVSRFRTIRLKCYNLVEIP